MERQWYLSVVIAHFWYHVIVAVPASVPANDCYGISKYKDSQIREPFT